MSQKLTETLWTCEAKYGKDLRSWGVKFWIAKPRKIPLHGKRINDNSLDESELEEKSNWVSDTKIHQGLIKNGNSGVQEKNQRNPPKFSSGRN